MIFVEGKGGKTKPVAMGPEPVAMIDALPRCGDFVFSTRDGTAHLPSNFLRDHWRTLIERADALRLPRAPPRHGGDRPRTVASFGIC